MGTTATKIKGKLKQAEGRVTGDKIRETQGKLEAAAGTVAGKVKRATRKAKTAKAVLSTKAGRKAAAAKLMP